MTEERQGHTYGPYFTKARLEAAERLGKKELLTVAGAARSLGIGKSTLYHYEDGTRRPSLDHLEDMAAGYGIMVGDLLPCSAIRSGEAAKIIAPLMAIPDNSRAWFIRQMASFAEGLAAAIADQSVTETFSTHGSTFAPSVTTDIKQRSKSSRKEQSTDEQRDL